MRSLFFIAALGASLVVSSEASAVSPTIVISEFRTRGANGANDEFIELHNKSGATVNVSNYQIMVSDSSGNTQLLAQLGTNVKIPAGRFYLLANDAAQGYSGIVAPNQTYTVGIPDDGGIGLFNASAGVVDEVGMSTGSAYFEGTPLAPMTKNVTQSYERNDGGCSPNQDTDDNAVDFRFNATTAFPQNAAVACNPCTGVKCTKPPNTQCFASAGTCSAGSCGYTRFTEGTTCTDGDACTTGDACDVTGTCTPSGTTQCNSPPAAFCSDPQTLVTYGSTGTCDSSTGCSYSSSSTSCQFGCNGTTAVCNPNPCTSVTCTTPPQTGCYDAAGTCNGGKCDYNPLALNTTCDDGNACTNNDTCDGKGGCTPGTATLVDDGNPCTADSCNPSTGIVLNAPVADNTSCDDGNLCNGIETCQAGSCTAGTAVTCNTPPFGGCTQSTGTCAVSTGVCTYPPIQQGTTCDDGNACTTNDACDGNGACAGQSLSCTTPPGQCYEATGTCAGAACSYTPKNQGAACDDGDACTTNDGCDGSGACLGTRIASCGDAGQVDSGSGGASTGGSGGTGAATNTGGSGGTTATGGDASVTPPPDSSTGTGGSSTDSGAGGASGSTPDSAAPTGGATGTGGSATATGGASTGTGGAGMSGAAGSGVADAGIHPDAGAGSFTSGGGGCGCSVPQKSNSAPWAFALSALAMLTAARRRARPGRPSRRHPLRPR